MAHLLAQRYFLAQVELLQLQQLLQVDLQELQHLHQQLLIIH